MPFHDEGGSAQSVFTIPMSVTDKLRRKRMMTVEEYAYARARARRPVKVTLPSPLMLFLAWSPSRSRDAYADPFELFADGLTLMREEAQELARMGCTYIQVDAPDFGQLVDPSQRTAWAAAGIPFERVMTEGADMLNELASVPGVTFGLHICKGNYDSHWISAGGYESVAGSCSRGSQLRPDPARVRGRALGLVRAAEGPSRRQDRRARPGLVEVRRARVARQLIGRIEEAARFYPRDQLALSTQCGFASAGPGNAITEEQERKLQLVAEVAPAAWEVSRHGPLPNERRHHAYTRSWSHPSSPRSAATAPPRPWPRRRRRSRGLKFPARGPMCQMNEY